MIEPGRADRIYCIRGVVDADICAEYIAEAHRVGWVPSDITRLNPLFSRAQVRISVDIACLFQAIRSAIPARLDDKDAFSLVAERTSCLRYGPGQFFGPHTDHPFATEDGCGVTLLSLVLYLNDGYSGGETIFPDLGLTISPEVGQVLLFDPNLRHESAPICTGEKYVIRSEVLYRRP